ncbi:class I tRNA ligase family protein [Candidatus Woesearchaeota archaeon]|nr:class I tRNA ligase family protein [Candidatus Woesearchaeota archaeon]
MNIMVDFSKIEKKWQKRWEQKKVFKVKENNKKKFYVLEMFPYPSGSGLHMGHAFNYTIGDIYSRFKRMMGFNVLYPMGYDSFGLPAENAAILAKEHPKKFTENSIKNFIRQQKELGLSYDWDRLLMTHTPEYYKWNQYFFLKFLENGLVYKSKASVNWCSKCDTVLANEQVHNGKCWRHKDTDVETKQLEQWFIKTTKYADELLKDIEKLQWSERIKIMQENWIGKSYGTEIEFEIFEDVKDKEFVFLHAYGDSSKDAFWLWLRKEIENKGGRVSFSPDLPNTNNPQYKEQSEFVLNNYNFNENSIVIGHSLGNILMMKLLSSGRIKIGKLIMVAPPLPTKERIISGKAFIDNKPRPALSNYCDWKFDFNKIKENVRQIFILVDKNDHIVPINQPMEIANKLEAQIITAMGNKTHYNGEKEEEVLNLLFRKWKIFTTRPDTLFGVTFMVISAQHPRLHEIVTKEQKKEVDNFLRKIKSTKKEDIEKLDKEGVFTGSYALHPLTNQKIPVYAGNFVIAEYGSGMVMAVPAHDQRDFEFAKKYNLKIVNVIEPVYSQDTEPGKIVDGLPFDHRDAIIAIVKHWSEEKYIGLKWKKVVWGTFITGGIEKNQTPEEAAKIEIEEETGYLNPKLIKDFGRVHGRFYHVPKKINRFAHAHVLYFELQNSKQKNISEAEKEIHEIKWLNLKELEKFLTPTTHKHALRMLNCTQEAYVDEGILTNSEKFNGLNSEEAKIKITKELENKKIGKLTVNYKLRDWLISRQRYWGTPIPIIYCDSCGIIPVQEKDLPVKLPDKVKFGKGNPLTTNKKFLNVKCPRCKKNAKRETDTMDTFFDSSWYFLRYCDNKNNKKPFDTMKTNYWMPVDQYIGGAEHACMHLIYARFFTKALRNMGYVNIDEPFIKLFNQGMLHGEDGFVMSKSRGNVVLPEAVSKEYGIDTARLFLISGAAPDKDMEWSSKGIDGSLRFVRRLIDYVSNVKMGKTSRKVESKLNKTIKDVTQDIEEFKYNLAIIKIRDLFDSLENEISKKDLEKFLKLIHPFCPHITEELWEKIGNKKFLSLEKWPEYDESKIDIKFEQAEKSFNNLVSDITNVINVMKEKQGKEFSKVYVYSLPNEVNNYNSKELSIKVNKDVIVYSVSDKNKYDPENKSKKAKPGKPAIFLE